MKFKHILSLTILLSYFDLSASAQTDTISLIKKCNLDTQNIFTKVNHPPYPTGGFKTLAMNQEPIKEAMTSVSKNQDSVVVRFIVTKDGNICDPIFIYASSSLMQSAILKILNQSIPWQPGTIDGGRMLNVSITLKVLLNYNQINNEVNTIISYAKYY